MRTICFASGCWVQEQRFSSTTSSRARRRLRREQQPASHHHSSRQSSLLERLWQRNRQSVRRLSRLISMCDVPLRHAVCAGCVSGPSICPVCGRRPNKPLCAFCRLPIKGAAIPHLHPEADSDLPQDSRPHARSATTKPTSSVSERISLPPPRAQRVPAAVSSITAHLPRPSPLSKPRLHPRYPAHKAEARYPPSHRVRGRAGSTTPISPTSREWSICWGRFGNRPRPGRTRWD